MIMKYIAAFIIFFSLGYLASAQVGVHTDFPDNSSAMDIVATDRGLLIPRVTLSSTLTSPSPVTSPAVGLMVFNSGSNQPIGFYYWNGTTWVMVGGGSSGGDFWSLTGNSGTSPGTDFLGTSDYNHLLVYTNDTERMRFEDDGQIIIGGTVPNYATEVLTVYGNSTQNSGINVYSPRTGFTTTGGRYGILSTVDTANGFTLYARNLNSSGYGIISVSSGYTSVGLIGSRSAGIHTQGYDGLHSWGKNANGYGIFAMGSAATGPFNISGRSAGASAVANDGMHARGLNTTGRGIIAIGSGQSSPSISNESEGGAFTGYHGAYAKGVNAQGIGVIGIGSNAGTYSTITGGLGGSFSGNYGVYGKGLASDGVGVVGLGSNGSGYYTVTNGSGGAFTGYHGLISVGTNTTLGTGVFGAGNNGSYVILPAGAGGVFTGITTGAGGFGTNSSTGIGVIGAGNNQAAWVPSNGCGGAFTGNSGVYSRSTNTSGTGIVSTGNNLANPGTFTNGAGGSFTGVYAGLVSWGTEGNEGIGVIGAGNNTTINIPTGGCGGAFTGLDCGVYGYATATNGDHYGAYFATAGNTNQVGYAYVAGRYSNTRCKIIGVGTVNTIVKNQKGELITLTCPEAPEPVFQDFGIGQLVDGFAHITIEPDLAININVDQDHPLKVYITPEGDCMGVYVTNKSANGFDVVELQGGQSNVPFSWQIVATRANEEFVLKDGTIEISDYSQRFRPAPGPMETIEHSSQPSPVDKFEIKKIEKVMSGKESYHTEQINQEKTLDVEDNFVIESSVDINE